MSTGSDSIFPTAEDLSSNAVDVQFLPHSIYLPEGVSFPIKLARVCGLDLDNTYIPAETILRLTNACHVLNSRMNIYPLISTFADEWGSPDSNYARFLCKNDEPVIATIVGKVIFMSFLSDDGVLLPTVAIAMKPIQQVDLVAYDELVYSKSMPRAHRRIHSSVIAYRCLTDHDEQHPSTVRYLRIHV
ncbi:hypothetical protein EW026_g7785 [Hermanssonia centrifuga]|uniref:Uncharacterized protein n=1 Tax=Hermanssonia centrifuga TaxID=98765 RepID=A0A4S4K8E8_9APHY|nr:hypothetical protein EW026_g7785 [Hermanssonia centrifuga]